MLLLRRPRGGCFRQIGARGRRKLIPLVRDGQDIVVPFRVAPELVVADSALRPDHDAAESQTRTLNDGQRFRVFKRYFSAAGLAAELGGGTTVHESDWFVAVSASR